MSRPEARKEFDADTRISLLEGDADTLEDTICGIQSSLQRLSMAFVGAAITFGTSAVLLAANLIIVR